MTNVTFKPDGDLSFDTIAGIHDKIKQTIKTLDDNVFVLDLSNIGKTDSAGLALLLDTASNLKKRALNYKFIGLSDDLISLAKFYEVESILQDDSWEVE